MSVHTSQEPCLYCIQSGIWLQITVTFRSVVRFLKNALCFEGISENVHSVALVWFLFQGVFF